MTEQMIPADDVREIAEKMHHHASQEHVRRDAERYFRIFAKQLDDLLPTPPTLADMTVEEREACRWMQCDVKNHRMRYVITNPDGGDGEASLIDSDGKIDWVFLEYVTPRPDLPPLELPGDKKPTPALPDGWRLADHPDHGRVIVTNPTPNRDGYVCYVLPADDYVLGYDWFLCYPDELKYLDQEAEDATPAKVGTVIESADDPRILALPIGTILLDCDGESVTKRRGEWEGDGCIPIAYEGDEFGPWTVLHIPKGADQ